MAETNNLEGDRFDTKASELLYEWQSAHPGAKLAGHELGNLEVAIAEALRSAYGRGSDDGYAEANKEWQTAPRDGFDGTY